jgi:hypothetical protein
LSLKHRYRYDRTPTIYYHNAATQSCLFQLFKTAFIIIYHVIAGYQWQGRNAGRSTPVMSRAYRKGSVESVEPNIEQKEELVEEDVSRLGEKSNSIAIRKEYLHHHFPKPEQALKKKQAPASPKSSHTVRIQLFRAKAKPYQ